MNLELRGDCLLAARTKLHEWILSGPRDTSKTWTCCAKGHTFCSNVPKCQGLMVRKTRNSMAGTVCKTFKRLTDGTGVRIIGGENPSKYVYPNGSAIWLAGMDDPNKALSGEWDFVYVNQAEELSEGDWEMLAGCCSGRGAVVANPQIFGDCNPAGSKHWIRQRAQSGKLKLFVAKHVDNPTIYTATGELLASAVKRMEVLEGYTGIRRKRLFEGVWATAEGAVYEMFDASIHCKVRDWREIKRWFLTVDVGWNNPFVVLLVGTDEDERWHVFKEFYEKGVLPTAGMEVIKSWWQYPLTAMDAVDNITVEHPTTGAKVRYAVRRDTGERFIEDSAELVSVDEASAGLIADLINMGVNAQGGKGKVDDGIHNIRTRLAIAKDGRPRLTLDPSCVETTNEFESYILEPDTDKPKKEFDHAMDALRYLGHVRGEIVGGFDADSIKGVSVGPNKPGVVEVTQQPAFTPRPWAVRPWKG